MLKRASVLLFAGFLLVFFGWGVYRLLGLRLNAGDIHSPYSSLRADPLGSKVFYDAVEHLNHDVQRNYLPLKKIKGNPETVFFFLGVSSTEEFPEESLRPLLRSGARVVLTLHPQHISKSKEEKEEEDKEPVPPVTNKEKERIPPAPWGIELLSSKADHATLATSDFALEKKIPWHGAVISNLGDEWETIYETKDGAVLVTRMLGAGRLIIATDSYFLSNEALWKDRHPKLLSWLTGDKTKIVFNETHHGIQTLPGLATLAKNYNLTGTVVCFLLLALLYIWRNSVPFIPPQSSGTEQATILKGKSAVVGFTNLLSRNISPKEIIPSCISEWLKSFEHQFERTRKEDLVALNKILHSEPKQDPVIMHQKIHEILERKQL